MNVKPRRVEDVAELRRLVAAEKVVVRDRFGAVLLALEGDEASVVAAKLGRGCTFAQDWVSPIAAADSTPCVPSPGQADPRG